MPYDPRDLQPATALRASYEPDAAPYAFPATNLYEAEAWQKPTREALSHTLGFQDSPPVDPDPERIELVDKGTYTREKILMRTAPHTSMPVYLLRPKREPAGEAGAAPSEARGMGTGASAGVQRAGPAVTMPGGPGFPVVLALHGHGYGVKDIVGLWEDGSERDTPDGYHRDFGVALCRQGFAVAAPEISCFGERRTNYDYLDTGLGSPVPTTCEQTAALATHQGGSVAGLRVRDARRLVDYLEGLPDFDTGRLGAMGISGGGMHTLFSTCLDTRIRAAVISGYFSTFRDSILAMHHCPCNFVHGLGAFGEMADLTGLIAPRPLFVEAGDHDPIFPLQAVREGLDRAAGVYDVFGAGDRLEHEIFEGRHRIDGPAAYAFLKRVLS